MEAEAYYCAKKALVRLPLLVLNTDKVAGAVAAILQPQKKGQFPDTVEYENQNVRRHLLWDFFTWEKWALAVYEPGSLAYYLRSEESYDSQATASISILQVLTQLRSFGV